MVSSLRIYGPEGALPVAYGRVPTHVLVDACPVGHHLSMPSTDTMQLCYLAPHNVGHSGEGFVPAGCVSVNVCEATSPPQRAEGKLVLPARKKQGGGEAIFLQSKAVRDPPPRWLDGSDCATSAQYLRAVVVYNG
ncbi:hypothetical protein H920_08135 [Fukomys damarensis]|uniref:Uncharacterized protein n=1 Tax=Fukomys damarensis TaxID=885580 RepID=A0A091DE61_FUKDA|nr:hypothetical protein H920_08135 [Fukomys damarensis]